MRRSAWRTLSAWVRRARSIYSRFEISAGAKRLIGVVTRGRPPGRPFLLVLCEAPAGQRCGDASDIDVNTAQRVSGPDWRGGAGGEYRRGTRARDGARLQPQRDPHPVDGAYRPLSALDRRDVGYRLEADVHGEAFGRGRRRRRNDSPARGNARSGARLYRGRTRPQRPLSALFLFRPDAALRTPAKGSLSPVQSVRRRDLRARRRCLRRRVDDHDRRPDARPRARGALRDKFARARPAGLPAKVSGAAARIRTRAFRRVVRGLPSAARAQSVAAARLQDRRGARRAIRAEEPRLSVRRMPQTF